MEEKKDYKELYERIAKSEWFKKAYHNKSLGECPIVVEELEESEDERIIDDLIDMVKYTGGLSKIGEKRLLAWLEKQKEQKPAECGKTKINGEPISSENKSVNIPCMEWSKEDEETLEKLHRLLVICRGEKKFIQEADYNKMDNLLKSLRPHWKPSEEQMEALFWTIHQPEEVNKFMKQSLGELYDDLKKLM